MIRVTSGVLQIREHQRDGFIAAIEPTLPPFDFAYVQSGTDLIPARRGLVTTTHPQLDYFLHSGKLWRTPDGATAASLPFTLMSRDGNCTHNGLLTFTLGKQAPGKMLVNQETCHFLKFDLWGEAEVSYTAGAVRPSFSPTPMHRSLRAPLRRRTKRRPARRWSISPLKT